MDDSEKKKKDLTRLEDISEFLHELNDPEVDKLLAEDEVTEEHELADIDSLPDLPDGDQLEDDPFAQEDQHFEENPPEDAPEDAPEDENEYQNDEENEDQEPEEEQEESHSLSEDFDQDQEDSFDSDFENDNDNDLFSNDFEDNQLDQQQDDTFDDQFEQTDQDSLTTSEQEDLPEQEVFEDKKENSIDLDPIDSRPKSPPQTPPPARESFTDVKAFAGSLSYGAISAAGNPPFSLAIRHIKYREDMEDILIILKEHGIVQDSNEEEYRKSMEMGSLLISQMSEYAAIFLAHKLRRFDLDIQMGLSEEIHPSKSYQQTHKGLSSKEGLKKSRSVHLNIENIQINQDEILVTTHPTPYGYHISQYRGVCVERMTLEHSQIETVNDPSQTADCYREIIERMKEKALEAKANALTGLSFQLTAHKNGQTNEQQQKFELLASATMAICYKRQDSSSE